MHQLSAQDASFIYLESPATPMHVGSLGIYDASQTPSARLSEDAVLRHIDSRLHLSQATRRRLQRVPLEADYPYWLEDADFDLEYHVRRVGLPRPGDWQALMTLTARIFSRPLDLSKPLWEAYIIDGLDNLEGVPPGSIAFMTKTHHAAIDGASGLHFLALLHDLQVEPTRVETPTSPWRPDPQPTDAELLMRASTNHFFQPYRLAERLGKHFMAVANQARESDRAWPTFSPPTLPGAGRLQGRVPKTRFNGRVTPHRVIGSRHFDLAAIKRIRQLVPGSTVNDVILTLCGGALRQYLDSKTELDELSLVAMAPVNVRSASSDMAAGGNRVSALFVPIGTDIADPIERLRAIQASTSASKVVHNAVGAGRMTDYSQFIPAFSAALGARLMTETAAQAPAPPFNVSITNVPGPRDDLYFCGAPMLQTLGLGPITQGMGLIFPVLSYRDGITVSFTSCREMLPDPEFFADCIEDAFNALHEHCDTTPLDTDAKHD